MSRIAKRAAGTDFIPDLDQWWEESPKTPERKPVLRVYDNPAYRPARPSVKPTVSSRKRRRANAVSRVLIYLTVALLVTGLAVQIGRLSQIAAQAKSISTLSAEIRQLDSEQQNLQVRLGLLQKSDRILDVAMNKLGMNYPAEGQVRVVSLSGYSADTPAISASNAGEGRLE